MSQEIKRNSIVGKFIPWIVSITIFVFLFHKYSPSRIFEASQHVNLPFFIGFSVLYFLIIGFWDTWNLSLLFGRFGIPVPLKELLPVRLASYLVSVLNYGAGQGVFAYFFKKKKNVPFFKSSSLVLFVVLIDLYWAISLAFLSSFFVHLVVRDLDLSHMIRLLWIVTTVGLLLFILFWRLALPGKFFSWIRTRDIFHSFHQATLKDYGLLLIMRLPMHLLINSSLFFIALTFGAKIPFWAVIAFTPVILLIGTIPITPGGLGIVQVATVEFFKNSIQGGPLNEGITSAELLLTMSLMGVFANYFLKALTGSIYLRKACQ